MQKQTFTLTILILFVSCGFALSAPDTPETRRHEAERYLQATPPKALFEHRGINQSDDRLDGEAFHH